MKLSYLQFGVLLVLLFSFSSEEEMVEEVEKSGRCIAVMDPTGCSLPSCKQHCFQSKNGNGMCLANLKDGYQCVCYYNC